MEYNFEIYSETYSKPTNILQSFDNSGGNIYRYTISITNNHVPLHSCWKKKPVKWLIKINITLRVN